MKPFQIALSYIGVAAIGGALVYFIFVRQPATQTPSTTSVPTSTESAPTIAIGEPTPTAPTTPATATLPPATTSTFGTGEYLYQVELDWKRTPVTTILTRTNKATSKKEVVSSNLDSLATGLKPQEAFAILAQPENSSFIILKVILPDTDSPSGDVYKFDTERQTLTRMNMNSVWQGGSFGSNKVSPNQKKVLFTEIPIDIEPRTLRVCDFATDTCTVITTLQAPESFDGGFGGLSAEFHLSWKDATTVQANVYIPVGGDGAGTKKLKEIRTYKVN